MAASPTRNISSSEPSRLIASQLGILAVCLLVLYVVAVLAAILPPALLDPAWQLRFTNALINNGFIALLGLALLHLAAYLHPTNPHLGRRRNDFATWALIPVLGFLLLIPLQSYAVWRGITTSPSSRLARWVRQARIDGGHVTCGSITAAGATWPWVASPPSSGSLSCRHEQPGGKAHLAELMAFSGVGGLIQTTSG